MKRVWPESNSDAYEVSTVGGVDTEPARIVAWVPGCPVSSLGCRPVLRGVARGKHTFQQSHELLPGGCSTRTAGPSLNLSGLIGTNDGSLQHVELGLF
jgi:hypothetical protein